MKKYYRIVISTFVILSLLQLSCKILEFENNPLVIDITLEEDYHFQGNNTTYNRTEEISLSNFFTDNDIPVDSIKDIIVKNIQILISENNSAPGSQLTFLQISFSPSPFVNSYNLANLSGSVSINDILNTPIDPYTTAATLGVNPAGIVQLRTALNASPPTDIRLTLSATVSAVPVDFQGTVIISLQIKYKPLE
ncbi:hypothetical protein JW824_14320 [bacterium]|nr:hypothetical protein [bacterium]